jgi:hypothetical protein
MLARWPALDDEQRTLRLLTPSMYTRVQMLEKREKTATLCHFLAGQEPTGSGNDQSPYRYRIRRSDVTTMAHGLPKVKWQEPPQKRHFMRQSCTLRMVHSDEIATSRPSGCHGGVKSRITRQMARPWATGGLGAAHHLPDNGPMRDRWVSPALRMVSASLPGAGPLYNETQLWPGWSTVDRGSQAKR